MRRPWAASAAIILYLALGGTPALAQEPSTEMGDGTGVLTVTVIDFAWEQFSGKELGGFVTTPSPEGLFVPVDGTISASIPGPSAEPEGVTQEPGRPPVGHASSVTAQLQLDGQPVHLAAGRYELHVILGEPDCFAGWNTTCDWMCRTGFDLRSGEDIRFVVGPVRVTGSVWSTPVWSTSCPVRLVAHRPPPMPSSEH